MDSEPGAVEADALRLFHDPLIGFDALEGPFLAELSARSLSAAAPFLLLSYDSACRCCSPGSTSPTRPASLWEAAAAVPFTAFCAAAEHPIGTSQKAPDTA